jgi:putative ABC transport system ATP-binding protein
MQLKIHKLSLQLDGKVLFQNFNLEIAEGEKVLLKGPSGSGKSTLLRLILGFVQADTGDIHIDGQLLDQKSVWSLRQRMAFVPQELTIGSGTVKDFIQDVFDYRANRHLKYREEQILDLFKQFELEANQLEQDISQLSGGEKQRLGLIVALLLDRELYLLDEVTSAIDEALREKIIRYLARLEGKTMVIVSHDRDWQEYGFREIDIKK